jgi:hypothetical protein
VDHLVDENEKLKADREGYFKAQAEMTRQNELAANEVSDRMREAEVVLRWHRAALHLRSTAEVKRLGESQAAVAAEHDKSQQELRNLVAAAAQQVEHSAVETLAARQGTGMVQLAATVRRLQHAKVTAAWRTWVSSQHKTTAAREAAHKEALLAGPYCVGFEVKMSEQSLEDFSPSKQDTFANTAAAVLGVALGHISLEKISDGSVVVATKVVGLLNAEAASKVYAKASGGELGAALEETGLGAVQVSDGFIDAGDAKLWANKVWIALVQRRRAAITLAFGVWSRRCLSARHAQENRQRTMQRATKRFIMCSVSVAWTTWVSVVQQHEESKKAMMKLLSRILRFKLSLGFFRLRVVVESIQSAEAAVLESNRKLKLVIGAALRATALLSKDNTSRAFRSWLEVNERVIIMFYVELHSCLHLEFPC